MVSPGNLHYLSRLAYRAARRVEKHTPSHWVFLLPPLDLVFIDIYLMACPDTIHIYSTRLLVDMPRRIVPSSMALGLSVFLFTFMFLPTFIVLMAVVVFFLFVYPRLRTSAD